VVIIGDELYMLYTAYDGVIAQIAAASISIDDFVNKRFYRWKRRGLPSRISGIRMPSSSRKDQ